jgi:hypothetical protein
LPHSSAASGTFRAALPHQQKNRPKPVSVFAILILSGGGERQRAVLAAALAMKPQGSKQASARFPALAE